MTTGTRERESFYLWVRDRCVISLRVSSSIERLFSDYCLHSRSQRLSRQEFSDVLVEELAIHETLARGIALAEDVVAFRNAYSAAPPEVDEAKPVQHQFFSGRKAA